mmetsp:Transcript_38047/g.61350  ORF Transcript_38047/g.61350 Transcript_38047/m.61350 type:complete len:172 (-) Transcript_38047:53-568(-)
MQMQQVSFAIALCALLIVPTSAFSSGALPALRMGGVREGEALAANRGVVSSRRTFAASVGAASLSFALNPSRAIAAEEVAVVEETPAAKDAREGTIYGQDPKTLMSEGALTLGGFAVVLGPTLLRGLGIGVPTDEEKEKYQAWGDLDGVLPAKPRASLEEKKKDISKGQSL